MMMMMMMMMTMMMMMMMMMTAVVSSGCGGSSSNSSSNCCVVIVREIGLLTSTIHGDKLCVFESRIFCHCAVSSLSVNTVPAINGSFL